MIRRLVQNLFGAGDQVRANDALAALAHIANVDDAIGILQAMRLNRWVRPQRRSPPSSARILVVAPHPDDEVIGPGGTLLAARTSGSPVHVLYLTSGRPHEQSVRETEARGVCEEIGATYEFARLTDGAIAPRESAQILSATVAAFKPSVLFVPFVLDDHPDHQAAGRMVADALPDVPEGSPIEVWAYQVYTTLPGNVIFDVSARADEKASLIKKYRSQLAARDWAHFSLGLNAFNSRYLRDVSGPGYGEMFIVTSIQEYVRFLGAANFQTSATRLVSGS